MSAASKLRRLDKDSEIIVFEKGTETSYGACGLPYYIGGFNDDVELLRIKRKEDFDKDNINLKFKHEVIDLDPKNKIIKVKNLESNELIEEKYDKLIIASGARPIIPPIDGLDKNLKNVFTVRTISDGENIKKHILSDKVNNVVIAGAGFIGLEMVEACYEQGKNVTLIEMLDSPLASVDEEIADMILKELHEKQIKVKLSEKIEKIESKNGHAQKITTDKNIYETDCLILATGAKPNTEWLKNTAIVMEKGAIVVNKKMETSIEDVYAGGDCALIHHKLLNKNRYIPLGTNANKQGKIIAENIAGYNKEFPGVLGTAGIKVIDLEIGRTGLTVKDAKNNNIKFGTVYVQAPAHAPYYPGSGGLAIKLIYETDTKVIIGGQVAGKKGAVLRADMLAIIIDAKYTANDVLNLDLFYAPPYSYIWDPIQIAAARIK